MKKLIGLAMTLILAGGFVSSAGAQEWPQKPIRIIVSFGPGGGADIIGRILADSMQAQLGKPVVVENKPGAGGIIGNEAVANADPDGYTLGIMTAGQIIAAVTRKNMRYDTLTAFAPIGQIATASLLIVTRPDFPANNVKELVAAAKADPGKIVFASPGFAATQHFAGEMFKQTAQVNLLHVPFKTSPEAINATLGKHEHTAGRAAGTASDPPRSTNDEYGIFDSQMKPGLSGASSSTKLIRRCRGRGQRFDDFAVAPQTGTNPRSSTIGVAASL